MEQIVKMEMDTRKLKIAVIISRMRVNEYVSHLIDTAIDLFRFTDLELDIWKYAGESSRFQEKITTELNTDANGFKSFLETAIDSNGITIYQYLMTEIN